MTGFGIPMGEQVVTAASRRRDDYWHPLLFDRDPGDGHEHEFSTQILDGPPGPGCKHCGWLETW